MHATSDGRVMQNILCVPLGNRAESKAFTRRNRRQMRAAGVSGERGNLLRTPLHLLPLTARTELSKGEWKNYYNARRFRYDARDINVYFFINKSDENLSES